MHPRTPSPYKFRLKASHLAAARLKASSYAQTVARIEKNYASRLASEDPRTAWLAREVICAAKTKDIFRWFRAMSELDMKTEMRPDGMVFRQFPVPTEIDHVDFYILRHSPENKMDLIEGTNFIN
jgi:hypothetical protein